MESEVWRITGQKTKNLTTLSCSAAKLGIRWSFVSSSSTPLEETHRLERGQQRSPRHKRDLSHSRDLSH